MYNDKQEEYQVHFSQNMLRSNLISQIKSDL